MSYKYLSPRSHAGAWECIQRVLTSHSHAGAWERETLKVIPKLKIVGIFIGVRMLLGFVVRVL